MITLKVLTNVKRIMVFTMAILSIIACKKTDSNWDDVKDPHDVGQNGHLRQAKTFSSDVAIKWLNMELDMMRVPLAAGARSQGADRVLAYNGIALYHSILPGMPSYKTLSGQLIAFPAMPSAEPGKAYHWAASANAAMAFINRKLFPNASDANKAAMDALENSLQAIYASEVDDATLQRSIAFGREVASRVDVWSTSDGSANVNPAYIPPVGPGLWVPTAPTPPVNPYASQIRLLVPGVSAGTDPQPPPTYSTNPASDFYKMVKDVYDKSLVLTDDQKAMAFYHRDAPGYPGGGHFVAVLSQVLTQSKATLDVAALACVKTGIGYHEAVTLCFTKKYQVNLVRPVTYIKDVMGFTSWTTLIPTPNHPEFPSAHATNAGAVAVMLTSVFGHDFGFTLDTYQYLGFPARNYSSFADMAKEMSDSRVFGGIHYQSSCDKGLIMGAKVGQNVLSKIKFR